MNSMDTPNGTITESTTDTSKLAHFRLYFEMTPKPVTKRK